MRGAKEQTCYSNNSKLLNLAFTGNRFVIITAVQQINFVQYKSYKNTFT